MQVFVTARAERNFAIVNHIADHWGKATAQQFIHKTDEIFQLLQNYPTMGQIENGDIRRFQLSRQTRLLYRIRNEKIIVLAFFDVRQDPSKKFS